MLGFGVLPLDDFGVISFGVPSRDVFGVVDFDAPSLCTFRLLGLLLFCEVDVSFGFLPLVFLPSDFNESLLLAPDFSAITVSKQNLAKITANIYLMRHAILTMQCKQNIN